MVPQQDEALDGWHKAGHDDPSARKRRANTPANPPLALIPADLADSPGMRGDPAAQGQK
jgi:hypothetical protein